MYGWYLHWRGSHFWVCITFCKMRHGDSVTKPDYYYYIITLGQVDISIYDQKLTAKPRLGVPGFR